MRPTAGRVELFFIDAPRSKVIRLLGEFSVSFIGAHICQYNKLLSSLSSQNKPKIGDILLAAAVLNFDFSLCDYS